MSDNMGYWIRTNNGEKEMNRCSDCGAVVVGSVMYPYCPMCGIKMDRTEERRELKPGMVFKEVKSTCPSYLVYFWTIHPTPKGEEIQCSCALVFCGNDGWSVMPDIHILKKDLENPAKRSFIGTIDLKDIVGAGLINAVGKLEEESGH